MPSIRPDAAMVGSSATLMEFAQRELLSPEEWEDFQRVASAEPPRTNPVWKGNDLFHVKEEASPDYLRKIELEVKILANFKGALDTGRWEVTAIPDGEAKRESIAIELLAEARTVSFRTGSIGRYRHVRIIEGLKEERFLTLLWFIKEVCAVVPPKQGVNKEKIKDLSDRLLSFPVRDDVFQAAWAEAEISAVWRKPGR